MDTTGLRCDISDIIGRIKIFAAPLQGFTEAAWRNAHHTVFGGVDAYFTPFVRLEKGDLRNKDRRDVDPKNNISLPGMVIPQIIASEPDELTTLADYLVSLGYRMIDVNMGCPFPLIVNQGKGSGILPHPDKVAALVECMADKKFLSDNIKFSIKMRLGHLSPDEWKDLTTILNDSCVSGITLHPRIGKQQYKGSVDLDSFGEFYSAVNKPLIYNGDLCSVDDIRKIISLFPDIKGVMIGRGLLADGGLAAGFKSGCDMDRTELCGTELYRRELYRKTIQMHSLMYQQYRTFIEGGDAQLLQKLKSNWEYWLPDLDKKKRKAILKANKLDVYLNEVNSIA